jgi:hypothetical protein
VESTQTGQEGEAAFGGFTQVDGSSESDALVAFLDWAERQSWAVKARLRLAEHLEPAAGSRIVDVGCGTGTVVALLHVCSSIHRQRP